MSKKVVRKNDSSFWSMAQENKREVRKWPDWKREITITSANASTGRFKEPIAKPKGDPK